MIPDDKGDPPSGDPEAALEPTTVRIPASVLEELQSLARIAPPAREPEPPSAPRRSRGRR